MQELCVARPGLAAVSGEPLSPPHSDHSEPDSSDKPMDLSSGGVAGVAAGLTQLFNTRRERQLGGDTMANLALSEHSHLFNARLAELVKQQHRESEERERESKRKWEEREEEERDQTTTQQQQQQEEEEEEREEGRETEPAPAPARHLIRAGWEGSSQEAPASPAGSSSGSESGPGERREEKRRRLDLLLTKKFDRAGGGGGGGVENILMSTPPPSERETSPASDRRPSTDSTGPGEQQRPHRRKQAQPSRPASPPYPALSLRPNSDLFPPVATSTPRRKGEQQHPTAVSKSPARNSEEKENKGEARPDVLQVNFPGLLAPFLTIFLFRCSSVVACWPDSAPGRCLHLRW